MTDRKEKYFELHKRYEEAFGQLARVCRLCQSPDNDWEMLERLEEWWDRNKERAVAIEQWYIMSESDQRAIKKYIDELEVENEETD